MNTELTPTEQEKVEQGANKHTQEILHVASRDKATVHFEAGVAFALSELCPARMVEFAEWERDNVVADGAPKRLYKLDGRRYTTAEIVRKYFEHLKQKHDATK